MRVRTGLLVTLSLAVCLAGQLSLARAQTSGSPLEGDRRHLIEGFIEAFNSGDGDNPLPPIDVPAGAGAAQVRASVDRYLRDLADEGLFSGAVLVARGDEILFEGGYGLANRKKRIPITSDSRFDIGSITKEITKTAIGQLARDGKLSLDDRLIDHVPDYPNRPVAREITIAQLVSHSSGLGDLFNERFESTPKEQLQTPRDFFPIFADEPLQFEPGAGRSYSNAGYIVLGAVIEGASGMSYTDYLQKHIFDPAGMADSGFPVRDGSLPELAIGYTARGGGNLSPTSACCRSAAARPVPALIRPPTCCASTGPCETASCSGPAGPSGSSREGCHRRTTRSGGPPTPASRSASPEAARGSTPCWRAAVARR